MSITWSLLELAKEPPLALAFLLQRGIRQESKCILNELMFSGIEAHPGHSLNARIAATQRATRDRRWFMNNAISGNIL